MRDVLRLVTGRRFTHALVSVNSTSDCFKTLDSRHLAHEKSHHWFLQVVAISNNYDIFKVIFPAEIKTMQTESTETNALGCEQPPVGRRSQRSWLDSNTKKDSCVFEQHLPFPRAGNRNTQHMPFGRPHPITLREVGTDFAPGLVDGHGLLTRGALRKLCLFQMTDCTVYFSMPMLVVRLEGN
ncbi:hypothetical protein CEXT_407451 [Caerostris extrusa]|uniref:Uncharacterized protein n=1 Tax=Caerostris extrusa TaxID=172846 RepID=A0AAV4QVJ2_CAEEX|nr:hypothetical protein CEXT_407451 [Caerostris extrusa]